MDVRGRRLRKQSEDAAAFTSSTAFDGRIAGHVVKTNMAHMVSLVGAREVPFAAGAKCLNFLLRTPTRPRGGAAAEDFHQQLEQEAVDFLGVETAGYLNLGKSRNDQVATAVRMELRVAILELTSAIGDLQGALLDSARKYGRLVIPGYTHMQRAQPVTVAHHFFAHFDALQRDAERLLQLYERVDLSPMGSAALGGTSVRADRKLVAELLGFGGITSNAMDAVSSRDLLVEALSCAANLMIDVSRMAEEHVLWSSFEFGLIELSDKFSASSSIMPQKKNPVVAEIARAKAGSVLGSLVAVCAILKALPYSYNLDLQETTPHLWRGMDDAIGSVRIMAGSVGSMKFRGEEPETSREEDYSTATSLANHLVREEGISFRQAHAIVGELVTVSVERKIPFSTAIAGHIGRVSRLQGKEIGMDEQTARVILDRASFLSGIVTEGGSNPRFIAREAKTRSEAMKKVRESVSRHSSVLKSAEGRLSRRAKGIARGVKERK